MSRRDKKRRTVRRAASSAPQKATSPSGWFVIVLWVLAVVLIGVTYAVYRSAMINKNHIHLPILWLIILLALTALAIVLTVQWFRSRSRNNPKGKPK